MVRYFLALLSNILWFKDIECLFIDFIPKNLECKLCDSGIFCDSGFDTSVISDSKFPTPNLIKFKWCDLHSLTVCFLKIIL